MEINDRIKKIIDYYDISINQFEVKICVTRGKIYKGLERNSDFGSTTIAKILDNCDSISPDWLLLGRGEMLRKNAQKKEGVDPLDMVSLEKYEKKVEECALLRAELNAMKEAASQYAEREKMHSFIGSPEEASM